MEGRDMNEQEKRLERLLNTVTLQSPDEAEQNDLVVCALDPPSVPALAAFFGPCAACGLPIHWSRTAPKRPPKVCSQCAVAIVEGRVPMPKET